jgi:hypothetical protein
MEARRIRVIRERTGIQFHHRGTEVTKKKLQGLSSRARFAREGSAVGKELATFNQDQIGGAVSVEYDHPAALTNKQDVPIAPRRGLVAGPQVRTSIWNIEEIPKPFAQFAFRATDHDSVSTRVPDHEVRCNIEVHLAEIVFPECIAKTLGIRVVWILSAPRRSPKRE